MANKSLFSSNFGRQPKTDTVNAAGGQAYQLAPKQALAQYAATGCLNGTFYATDHDQLAAVIDLCNRVEPEFVARAALYSRSKNLMKDLPALLCAILSRRGPGLLAEVFDRVIDSPKMLRNFVQIIRSGAAGRKSLGTLPRRLVRQWLDARSDDQLFNASVGADPSLADVIRMVHPRPASASRAALYGYLIGRPHDVQSLPQRVRDFEAFKRREADAAGDPPDVPFQLLTGLPLTPDNWKAIARRASWQTTRMNLNTFARHGVLADESMTELIANRLRDPAEIARAKVLPYQLMVAHANTSRDAPAVVREALQDALDTALSNVPEIDGRVFVFPDVSGSMTSPITGHRKGSSSAVRCVDVAALIAAALLRKNRQTEVIAFCERAIPMRELDLNPRDSVLTNAGKLAARAGGGTNCSAPLALLNQRRATGDLIIYVSDNESWVDSPHYGRFGGSATETLNQWAVFKRHSPRARMICIDLQPGATTQAAERENIINVGGFSDAVFELIAAVASGRATGGHWVREIEAMTL